MDGFSSDIRRGTCSSWESHRAWVLFSKYLNSQIWEAAERFVTSNPTKCSENYSVTSYGLFPERPRALLYSVNRAFSPLDGRGDETGVKYL